MIADAAKVLVMGFGNPGRLDDGLGPALASAIEKMRIPGVVTDADYQLMLEDAAAAAKFDVVVFADADTKDAGPFYFRRIEPVSSMSFSTHSLRPNAVMGLARDLFSSKAQGYMLGIRGYEFNEYCEALSEQAQANLASATSFLGQVIRDGNFGEATEKWSGTCQSDDSDKVQGPVNEVEICKTEKK